MNAILVIDLAFGDCGKGTVVDFLTRHHNARAVVRFNGGPQAGHNVVTPDGRHHTFSQLGSGTFVAGVRTFLSKQMLVEPYALFAEAKHLADIGVGDALDRLAIDARAPIITPCHRAANCLRELARGADAHGTCGLGVGETVNDLLRNPTAVMTAHCLQDHERVRDCLRTTCSIKALELAPVIDELASSPKARFYIETLTTPTWIDTAVEVYAALADQVTIAEPEETKDFLTGDGTVVFEGAQGALLDERFGFHPHTTWSKTTFTNAEELLKEINHRGATERVGVVRSYFTRHGAGPMVTESPELREKLPEPHNGSDGWQGNFRVGRFDAVAVKYALAAAGGVNWLAVTHLDRVGQLPPEICIGYSGDVERDMTPRGDVVLSRQERLTALLKDARPIYSRIANASAPDWCEEIESQLGCAIGLRSFGRDANAKSLVVKSSA